MNPEQIKASTAARRAVRHHEKAEELFKPISDRLAEILCDEGAHIFVQTDGLCIAFNGGMDNAPVSTRELDDILNMDRDTLFDELQRRSI